MKNKLVIVCGGTASGKSTITKILFDSTKGSSTLVNLDDYYKDNWDKTLEERKKVNYDHPSAFEWKLLKDDLSKLIDGKEITGPVYDFTVSQRSKETKVKKPNDIIILEGILSGYDEEIVRMADMIIYVTTAPDVRLARRIKRDVEERGRTLSSVLNQWMSTVRPMHNSFVSPSKRHAHLIVPEGGENKVAVDVLINAFNSYLKK